MNTMHRPPTDSPEDQAIAVERMNQYIDEHRSGAEDAVNSILRDIPHDRIVPKGRINFNVEDGALRFDAGTFSELVHHNAADQIADVAGLPSKYAHDLRDQNAEWATHLMAHNLNQLFDNRVPDTKRFLTRSVNGQVRGFLSDKFKRIDSRPIMHALLTASRDLGAIVSEGWAAEVRVNIKAILPVVHHPAPGEYIVYGLQWTNSDFGHGANSLSSFMTRIWCINRAIMSQDLRQVHLGARLPDDVDFSERTMTLDTEATAAAIGDTVRYLLGPARIAKLNENVRASKAKQIDPDAAVGRLRRELTKAEADAVKEVYRSADVIDLPAGNDAWRFSNALSLIANRTTDPERRHEIQVLAGKELAA